MKIIKAGYSILDRDEDRGGLRMIERAGRVCYKSEDKITEDSAEGFVRRMIQRGHLAMLEHGEYIFLLDDYKILDNVAFALRRIKEDTGRSIMLTATNIDERPIISGNVRVWREFMAADTGAKDYFAGKLDPVYVADLVPEWERVDDPRVHPIHAADLRGDIEHLVHERQTVLFTVDRGVSHEFVRHRVFSFAQESTRYCNYSQGRFGGELQMIEPCYLTPHTEMYDLWKRSCMSDEVTYFTMLNYGLQPQEARAILPQSTKTELVMTGALWAWDHFFDLRARQMTGPAHPQAVEVARPLMLEMMERFPALSRA